MTDEKTADDTWMHELVEESLTQAQELLRSLVVINDEPFDAMMVLMLASAALAKSIGMPRETLLEGTAAAFNSISKVDRHVQ